MRSPARLLSLALALALLAAACGSDAETTESGAADDEATTDSTEAMEDDAMEDEEAMEDDAMEDEEAMEDDAMEDEEAMEDDAMEDEEAMEDDAMEEEGAHSLLGLEIVSIDFDSGEVVVANNGPEEVNLDGFSFCNFPDYKAVEGVGAVAPGETVTVVSPVALNASDGELGIYTESEFASPDAIQAYVEWGSDGHMRASVAETAGIWDGNALTPDGNTLTVG